MPGLLCRLFPGGALNGRNTRGGILPDPIALREVRDGLLGLVHYDHSAIVFLVPPHRVEDELPVWCSAIYEWRAPDDVVRHLLEEAGGERLEGIRNVSLGGPVAFE